MRYAKIGDGPAAWCEAAAIREFTDGMLGNKGTRQTRLREHCEAGEEAR